MSDYFYNKLSWLITKNQKKAIHFYTHSLDVFVLHINIPLFCYAF